MKPWNKAHPLHLALREQLEPSSNQANQTLTTPSRRTVFKLAGLTGLGLGLGLGFALAPRNAAASTDSKSDGLEPNGYVHIAADGRIRIYAPNPEIGQGVKTSMPIIVAAELGANWDDVVVEQAPVDSVRFGRQSAGGSTSILRAMESLRRAGATARLMLESAAAAKWQVPIDELRTESSRVTHQASGRMASFAELSEAASKQAVPNVDHLVAEPRKDFSLGGKRITGVDNYALVVGEPLFGIDQQLPGMRYATYTKCPAPGGLVESFNRDEVLSFPGVEDAFAVEPWGSVWDLRSGVAIVADSTWHAIQAKRGLDIEWDLFDAADDDVEASLRAALALEGQSGPIEVEVRGDAEAAYQSAEHKLVASYAYPFLSHAQLEPQNCTAWHKGDQNGIEIWAPSQTIQMGRAMTAQMLGLAREQVLVHQTRAGGGFGRRLANDYMLEAAAIAQRIEAPVKLQWTREDDMACGHYRAAGVHHFRAGVKADGRLASFQNHHVSFTADGEKPVHGGGYRRGEFPALAARDIKVTQTLLPFDTPMGFWRAPGSNGIAFANQSFLHELSVAAGRDHNEFLLELLDNHPVTGDGPWNFDPRRAKGVLQALARRERELSSSVSMTKLGEAQRRAQGVAFYFSHAGYVAINADVSVSTDRQLKVHQVLVSVDVGPIVHESGAKNQCEGSVIDAMSTLMGLEITCREGCAEQENFHAYPLGRIAITPQVIDVTFVDSGAASSGLGEPVFPPVAPAICNAIFNATGQRLRRFPLVRFGYSYA